MAQTFGYDIDNIANAPMWAKEDTQLRIEALLRTGGGLPPKTEKDVKKLGTASDKTSKSFDRFNEGVESLVDGAASIAGSFLDTSGRIDSLNPVVDTLASLLQEGVKGFGNLIPVIGDGLGQLGAIGIQIGSTVTQAIATELDEVASAFRGIASRGATLNGNLGDIITASASAGFGIEGLSKILDNNTSVLMAFGDASQGAERVLANLAALREDELYMPLQQLGFTVEGLADVASQYYETLVRTGRLEMLQEGNEREVARLTSEYAKNLALISRLTGRNVDEIQQEIRQRQEEGFIIVSNRKIAQRSGDEVLRVVEAASSLFNDPQLNNAIRMTLTDIGMASPTFEALFTQFPQAREALREFQTGLKDGTITEQQAKTLLDEIILAFKTEGQQGINLAEFSPYASSEFLNAINTSAASIVDFANSTDKNLTTADDAIQALLNASENNIKEIITLEEETRQRALEFQKVLGENVSELSTQLVEAYGRINDIMMSFVDPDIDPVDVIKQQAEDLANAVYEAVGSKIDTAYQTIDNAIIEMTGGQDGFVAEGRETVQGIDRYIGGLIRATMGMTPEGGEFIDAFKNEGGDVGYFENLVGAIQGYNQGTAGVQNFGEGTLARLHGQEAVIPAPRGDIPVDLGSDIKNLLAQNGVNSVQSKQVVAKFDEMIGVLKTIADGQYAGNSMFGKEIRRLGNTMSADLYR